MRDNFHLLNVGTAHGVFLYDLMRQSGKSGKNDLTN